MISDTRDAPTTESNPSKKQDPELLWNLMDTMKVDLMLTKGLILKSIPTADDLHTSLQ